MLGRLINMIRKRPEAKKQHKINREDRTVSEYDSWKFLRTMAYIGLIFIGLACFKAVVVAGDDWKAPEGCPECNPCLVDSATKCMVKPILPANYFQNTRYYLSALGMELLIAGASFCIGGLLGLLFGIPRFAQAESNDESKSRNRLRQNDNLVEISDWITKIIVGVGLTQIYRIPEAFWKLGNYLSACFNSGVDSDTSAGIIGVVTVLYFLSVGFLTCYLWTRINFSTLLAKNQKNLESLEQQLEEKDIELETKDKEVDALSKQVSPLLDEMRQIIANPSSELVMSDPHKNKFGGKAEQNGRKATATVEQASFADDFFTVNISVMSVNNLPLTGQVKFYLHPTYRVSEEIVTAVNGVATLNILAWGAFTVGIECDAGATKLELDLAELSGAPKKFRER